MLRSLFAAIALAGLSSCICPKASETLQPSVNNLKWVDLFNGKDMSGWVPVNVKPDTATVKDGMIFISGEPTGVIRSERKYTNFVLEYEWMHTVSKGNSGVFICADPSVVKPDQPYPLGIEVQALENDYGMPKPERWYSVHGDLFPVWGSKMTCTNTRPENKSRSFPRENRSLPRNNWNKYVVTCIDGNISLSVNGKFVSTGLQATPASGYLCLESEGAPIYFRNLRILELPDSAK